MRIKKNEHENVLLIMRYKVQYTAHPTHILLIATLNSSNLSPSLSKVTFGLHVDVKVLCLETALLVEFQKFMEQPLELFKNALLIIKSAKSQSSSRECYVEDAYGGAPNPYQPTS